MSEDPSLRTRHWCHRTGQRRQKNPTLVKRKVIREASTPEWPTLVSHIIGSFVGHSPNDMLCPLVKQLEAEIRINDRTWTHIKGLEHTSERTHPHTHTHTHTHDISGCEMNSVLPLLQSIGGPDHPLLLSNTDIKQTLLVFQLPIPSYQ